MDTAATPAKQPTNGEQTSAQCDPLNFAPDLSDYVCSRPLVRRPSGGNSRISGVRHDPELRRALFH